MAERLHKPTHRVGAFAIIFDAAGKVLVSRRVDSGWFNLPGGGVDPDESVPEGLIREVREETGLEVEVGRLVGVYSKPQKHELVLTFRAQIIGGEIMPSDEADYHTWVAADELDTVKLLPKHRERIDDALRDEAVAVVKDQRDPSLRAAEAEEIGGM
ncbi:MAG: NUDIX domain-containing protein [Chloroflexota bacterium]|nr:NUDIX domain-containing protein [Chloroflexota bacterium]